MFDKLAIDPSRYYREKKKEDIFRYSIQNAFDRNPATSWLKAVISYEFQENDTKMSIINGYAINYDSYKKQ